MAKKRKAWVGNSTTSYDIGEFKTHGAPGWQKKIVRRVARIYKTLKVKQQRVDGKKQIIKLLED